ncbi:tRNA (adenosine(37)-N6)-dimethylallyltransferase MiaA [filamentous cyanobacterium CCP5]|nr:tRNA (adenosine(37)-N6)-dimethylallyltransferase MiaA [filamentous cyanobacterium CCP5]
MLKTHPNNPKLGTLRRSSFPVPILVVIGGATATGKSGLALALGKRLKGGIISADSRQIYREFDIGTAKPSASERKWVPHYLIDVCDPTSTMTLAEFQLAAQYCIHQLHQQGEVPLLVGGTGLYIDAVVRGLKIPPVTPQEVLRSQFTDLGQRHSYGLLNSIDPAAAAQIHPNDAVRTQRALEVFYVTGKPISKLQGENPPDYPILYLGLDADMDRLEVRIAKRTRQMLEQGLVAEVAELAERYGWDLSLMQTLGYREIGQYLRGRISLAEAERLTIQSTRQFAKRQRTWFYNRAKVRWFDADAPDLVDQVWADVQDFINQVASVE